MSEKRRYKNYQPEVLSATQEDELLKSQAKEIKEMYDQRKAPPFKVAFIVYDDYQIWKKRNAAWGFNFFLHNLIEAGKLKSKKSTLKLAYKVATCFPDLRNTKAPMPFDSYREIANTKSLTQSQMNELRKDAEENHYSGRRIREIIIKMVGDDKEEVEPKGTSFQKYITYTNDEQFIKAVKAILEGPERPTGETKFLLKKLRR